MIVCLLLGQPFLMTLFITALLERMSQPPTALALVQCIILTGVDLKLVGAPAVQVTVHGTGRLLMFSSVEPSKCMLDGVPVEYEYENTSSRLVVTLPRSKGLDHNLAVLL